jgi:hypothetical protein
MQLFVLYTAKLRYNDLLVRNSFCLIGAQVYIIHACALYIGSVSFIKAQSVQATFFISKGRSSKHENPKTAIETQKAAFLAFHILLNFFAE